MRAYGLGNYDHFIDTRGHFFEADDIVISILVACLIKKNPVIRLTVFQNV